MTSNDIKQPDQKRLPLSNSNQQGNIPLETNLHVNRNALIFEQTVIQISNVAKIWAGYLPKPSFPFLQVAILLIGGVSLWMLKYDPLPIIGFCLILFAGYIIYKYFSHKILYTLNIELNSGNINCFFSEDKQFIDNMLKILIAILVSNSRSENIIMDFKDANLTVIQHSNLIDTVVSSISKKSTGV